MWHVIKITFWLQKYRPKAAVSALCGLLQSYCCCKTTAVVRVFQQDGQDVTPYDLDLLHDPNCLNVTVLGTHWQ